MLGGVKKVTVEEENQPAGTPVLALYLIEYCKLNQSMFSILYFIMCFFL